MVTTGKSESLAKFDRLSEQKAFDETKAGVKGIVDAGITEIPRIFYHPSDQNLKQSSASGDTQFSIPVVDLGGLTSKDSDSDNQKEIVERVREASEKWGFFQIVNHGIPESVLEEMKDGVRRFHEQDTEVKKRFYTRDASKPLVYNSNFDLYSAPSTNWRDSFLCLMAPSPPDPHDLPEVCRYSLYQMFVLGLVLHIIHEIFFKMILLLYR